MLNETTSEDIENAETTGSMNMNTNHQLNDAEISSRLLFMKLGDLQACQRHRTSGCLSPAM